MFKKNQHINTYYEWSVEIEDKKYSENELLVLIMRRSFTSS